jgi:nicotinamide-nucleotide amidase
LGNTRGRDWIRTVSAGEVLNALRLRLMANSVEALQGNQG